MVVTNVKMSENQTDYLKKLLCGFEISYVPSNQTGYQFDVSHVTSLEATVTLLRKIESIQKIVGW